MNSEWRPFTLPWDDAPIDISFVFQHEAPAGKHGFLTTEKDRMVFEDGTEARFWGTLFNSGANFPSHEYSEMVSQRLAKFGINIVRTHQMDGEWATPNIFQFNRAQPKNHTRSFDSKSLDRLDYLIYCLKQQGIYIYLDQLSHRKFKPGDDVDAVAELPEAAKPYNYFDRRLIELQKEYVFNLWNHVNPYTGLAYKDESAIALAGVVNESDLFFRPVTLEPYRSRLERQFRTWAAEHNHAVDQEPVDFTQLDPLMARFFLEVQQSYYREMIDFMRENGVQIPITGTNYPVNVALLASQTATDYTDAHYYWNFPGWEQPEGTDTRPMVGEVTNAFAVFSFMRTLTRPFFASEWDHAWPDEWRAESPLAYAAVASFQGWSGVTVHTYRYSTWEPANRLGGGASPINGITYRKHYDTFNDPAKFGLFYHAALIFRRGDVAPASTTAAVEIPHDLESWLQKGPCWPDYALDDVPALRMLPERHRVGLALPGDQHQADLTILPERQYMDTSTGEILSDTGQLWRSWEQRFGWIDTPRTKVAYGFLGQAGPINLEGLQLEVQTDFATIALSSLTDAAIQESNSLLLTAVGRCDNSGARYDEERRRQLDPGHEPVLIEPIRAHIAIATGLPYLKVWAISDRKEAIARLSTEYKDGMLSFEIGPQAPASPSTIYYMIGT